MDMSKLRNMIDDEHKITINDMGTAPVIAAMTDVLGIPQYVNQFLGSNDPRVKVDTGTAVKALLINILYGRKPLVHVAEAFSHLDCEVLFGKDISSSNLNDDYLGKALEELGSNDFRKLYSKICMNALNLHSCAAETIHVDTTNISVHGEYDSASAEDFEITYGNPKSKRTDLKQLNIGMFVQQNGFPVGGNALSGNNSDAVWFRDALDEISQIFSGDLRTMPICIFDAAGSNDRMFIKANDLAVPSIIRMSDRFNTAKEHIGKAWEEDCWSIVDKNGEKFEKVPKKDYYKLRSYDISINDFDWRLVVVYSSALQKTKETTAKRNYLKNKERLEKSAIKLSKNTFDTDSEAMAAGEEFVKANISTKVPFKYEISVEKKETSKYNKRGKPGKDAEKTTSVKYSPVITIGERDDDLYNEWLRQESCFVLVSNVPNDRCTTEKIFKEYKEQWVIEDKFKFLKQPLVLGPIWLQKPERVKGLIFVLLLSVVVSMYICYRCMVTLQGKTGMGSSCKEPVADSPEDVISNNSGDIEANVRQSGRGQKLLTTDGRLVDKPTYKVIKKLLDSIKTITKFDSLGNEVRRFAYDTDMRRLDLVIKIGFDPIIYIEKFTLKMDLWEYKL